MHLGMIITLFALYYTDHVTNYYFNKHRSSCNKSDGEKDLDELQY